MNGTVKKIIIYIIASIVLLSAGILIGRCGCNKRIPGELTAELEQARLEVQKWEDKYERQCEQFEQIERKFEDVGKGIGESIDIIGQTDESLGRLRQELLKLGDAAGDSRAIISQLRTIAEATKIEVERMSEENSRLRNKLKELQGSSSQQ